ncbi:MAG: hypothetical protein R3308_07360, partial [Thiohalobacterales bacterium]|nr:hypothetical protein [Thiohalobacterales bacterium]
MTTDNPLLKNSRLPEFSAIQPEHVEPAIDTLLQQARDKTDELLKTIESPDWHNFVEPLEEVDDILSRAWSPISHMNSVVNTDELRDAYNACLPKLSAYATEMGQNVELFEAYNKVQEHDASLDVAQQKMIE